MSKAFLEYYTYSVLKNHHIWQKNVGQKMKKSLAQLVLTLFPHSTSKTRNPGFGYTRSPSLVDIHVIKVFGRATNGLLSRSLLFHSFLSLFSHPNVRHFCFFQEEEDRKIIKKGLPFFFAFLWIVGVPVDVNVTDSLSVFCPFCPPLTLVFPLVKSRYVQKKKFANLWKF